MFEHKTQPLLSTKFFARRQALHFLLGLLVILFALALGTIGYKILEGRNWIDSMYSAAMILAGMGPAFEVKSDATKIFASAYAIFSGIIFLTSASVILAPAAHRIMHILHMEDDEEREKVSRRKAVGLGSHQSLADPYSHKLSDPSKPFPP